MLLWIIYLFLLRPKIILDPLKLRMIFIQFYQNMKNLIRWKNWNSLMDLFVSILEIFLNFFKIWIQVSFQYQNFLSLYLFGFFSVYQNVFFLFIRFLCQLRIWSIYGFFLFSDKFWIFLKHVYYFVLFFFIMIEFFE